MRRKTALALVLLIVLASAGLRLYNLASPGEYMFDEVYYAKDAKAILDGRMDPKRDYPWEPGDVVSWAHPDAGKMAIAVGIALLGDRPMGWRVPAALAGLALLALVYPIARRLGLGRGWSVVALTLAAADLLGIAQSRIATLDVFVAAWTVACIWCALRYVQGGRRVLWLLACGLAGGLAVATKWSGVLALLAAAILIALGGRVARLRPQATAEVDTPGETGVVATGEAQEGAAVATPAARQDSAHRSVGALLLEVLSIALALVALPAAVYLASYAPYFADGHTWAHFRELHAQMWHFNTTLAAPHSYASAAPTWILDYRPVWYSFVDKDEYYGVVGIGNPFLWWTALLGIVATPVLALRRRITLPLAPVGLVAVLYLPWFATSRTSFLYYMTPVAPFLAVLLATLAATLVAGGAPVRQRTLLWLAAAAAVVTAVGWDRIGRAAAFLCWDLPARASGTLALAVTAGAIAAAVTLVAAGLARKRTRPLLTAAVLGCVVGICVPFLPIVMDLGMRPDDFYRLIWFPSWI